MFVRLKTIAVKEYILVKCINLPKEKFIAHALSWVHIELVLYNKCKISSTAIQQ